MGEVYILTPRLLSPAQYDTDLDTQSGCDAATAPQVQGRNADFLVLEDVDAIASLFPMLAAGILQTALQIVVALLKSIHTLVHWYLCAFKCSLHSSRAPTPSLLVRELARERSVPKRATQETISTASLNTDYETVWMLRCRLCRCSCSPKLAVKRSGQGIATRALGRAYATAGTPSSSLQGSDHLSLNGRAFRLAIVGAGPAGFYSASRILGLPGSENVKVDMYEELPVPFGLVRYGVAPDHPEVKVSVLQLV